MVQYGLFVLPKAYCLYVKRGRKVRNVPLSFQFKKINPLEWCRKPLSVPKKKAGHTTCLRFFLRKQEMD